MELWLVRHGTTQANLEGRLQGTLPFSLCAEGRKEVLRLARRLQDQPFSAFFCSSNPRARQTAQLLVTMIKSPPPLFTPLLQEYHWGIVQGMTRQEIGRLYPALLEQLQRDLHRAQIPEAEGIERLFRRVERFYHLLKSLEQKRKHRFPLLIVSHGKFLHAFIQYFLAYNPRQGWPFSVLPASLTIMESDYQGRRRLKLFNDICHLGCQCLPTANEKQQEKTFQDNNEIVVD